jgi:hypothetical protein
MSIEDRNSAPRSSPAIRVLVMVGGIVGLFGVAISAVGLQQLGYFRPTSDMNLAELKRLINGGIEGRGAPAWKGIYYCGSKDNFHYLCNRMIVGADHKIRIPAGDLEIVPIQQFPLPESEWVSLYDVLKDDLVPEEITGE